MFQPSDAQLVREILGGRPASYEALVLRYQRAAFAVALSVGVSPDTAPDVLQDAFLRALHKLGELRNAERFGAWFLAIVRNAARRTRDSERHHASSEVEIVSREEPVWLKVERGELRVAVLKEVRSLPYDVREAVFLYYWEGESVRRVARRLGTTSAAIKNRLHRGRKILRERLWRSLGETLRDMVPSAREERRGARRLSLIVLSTLAATGVEASRGGAIAAEASISTLSAAQAAGALTMTMKKMAAMVSLCVLLCGLGFLGGAFTRPPVDGPAAVSVAPDDTRPTDHISRPTAPSRSAAPAKPEKQPATVAALQEPPPAPTTGGVLVTVVHSSRNEPAGDIEVRLVPLYRPSPAWTRFFAKTDDRGQATFEGLPPDRYLASFDRAAIRGRQPIIEVTAGETTEIRLRLPEGIRVEGEVVDSAGLPVAGAEVLVSRDMFDAFSAHPLTISGPDGRFSLAAAARGRYVSARKEGFAPSSQHALNADTGATIELRLVLPGAGGAVTGRIVDPDSEAIPSAIVMVGNRDISHGSYAVSAAPFVTRSDAEGVFFASGMALGTTPVVARAPGFAPHEATVVVEAGRSAVLELTLEPGVTLQGFVLTSTGDPVKGATLLVGTYQPFVYGTDPLVTRTRSDADGRYRLTGLVAGSISIAVSAEGRGKARPTIDAEAGETIDRDIELNPPLVIRGQVVLEDGTPLRKAMVSPVGLHTVFTDGDGRFVLKNCEDKEYRVAFTENRQRIPCATEVLRPGDDEVEVVVREENRSTATVKGQVVDADGRSVRSAKVRLVAVERRGEVRAESGFFGGFRAGPTPPGKYRIWVEADGWPRTWLEKTVTLESETRVDVGKVRLARPGWLRVEFSGAPTAYEGVYFGIFDEEKRCLVAVSLSSDPVRRERLVPGRHRVVIRDHGAQEEKLVREFEIVEGKETVLQLDVEGGDR